MNFLVVAARIDEHTIFPLAFKMLEHKGNSNTNQRIEIMQHIIDIFGAKSIRNCYADRQFIGEEWIQYLEDNKIHYYIRLKSNQHLPYSNTETKPLSYFFDGEESRFFEKDINGRTRYFEGKRLTPKEKKNDEKDDEEQDDFVIVMTNKGRRGMVLNMYSTRFHIEFMFKCMKKHLSTLKILK